MRTQIFIFFMTTASLATAQDYQHSSKLSPNDYLLNSYGKKQDPVFDHFPSVDLGVDFGVGADCGRINIRDTMRASFKNILDSKYIEDMGQSIIASSPMLLACYYSPTWCAILKQTQLRASLLANLRLDQCSMIDKYVDQRVEDYQAERQKCVRSNIAGKNGNFEEAMESCGGDYYKKDLTNWSGGQNGSTIENRLLGSSAKWAGFQGQDADRVVTLAKALVGDTVIRQGVVSVDFGANQKPLTPRTHLLELEKKTYSQLCEVVVKKIEDGGGAKANIENVVSEQELKNLSTDSEMKYVDYQTLRSLSLMPYRQRLIACKKLSDAISMTVFTNDMSKSMDFLSSRVETNPNLPDHRKKEALAKRVALKDQIEVTLSLYKNKNEPLNNVLQQINTEGEKYSDYRINENMRQDSTTRNSETTMRTFFDCSDNLLCNH